MLAGSKANGFKEGSICWQKAILISMIKKKTPLTLKRSLIKIFWCLESYDPFIHFSHFVSLPVTSWDVIL